MKLTQSEPLPPGAIIGAAESDLASAKHNSDPMRAPPYLQYAFHRKHVRAAETPRQLIELALSDLKLGTDSTKRNTREIYTNVAALRAAWERLS